MAYRIKGQFHLKSVVIAIIVVSAVILGTFQNATAVSTNTADSSTLSAPPFQPADPPSDGTGDPVGGDPVDPPQDPPQDEVPPDDSSTPPDDSSTPPDDSSQPQQQTGAGDTCQQLQDAVDQDPNGVYDQDLLDACGIIIPDQFQAQSQDIQFAPMALIAACGFDVVNAGNGEFEWTFTVTSPTTDVDHYEWLMGDGTTITRTPADGASFNYTYGGYGSYDVTLTCHGVDLDTLQAFGNVTIYEPLVAAFTLSTLTGTPPLDVTVLSNDSTGTAPLTYQWSVTGPNSFLFNSTDTIPTFPTFNDIGTYTVTLIATDSGSNSAQSQQFVIVAAAAPSADFTRTPTSGVIPLDVTVQGIDLGGGPITTWSWDFGDGSPVVNMSTAGGDVFTDPFVHQYTAEGLFLITLTYTGPGGGGTRQYSVNPYTDTTPVVSTFTWVVNDTDANDGVDVCFTNTSTGPVATSHWTFGNATPTVINNNLYFCYTYASEGTYQARLRVEASNPAIFSESQRTVSAFIAPIASFTRTPSGNPVQWQAGAYQFTDTSQNLITQWEWDLDGDGTYETSGQNPTYSYGAGTHTVRLRVTGFGGTSTAEETFEVTPRLLTCDYTGNLNPFPGQTILYDGTVGNLGGASPSITYAWTVYDSGNNPVATGTTQDFNYTWNTSGTYTLEYVVTTSDPNFQSCAAPVVKTVTVDYPAMNCNITGNFAPYPNGTNYSYTAVVNDPSNRNPITITWLVDGGTPPVGSVSGANGEILTLNSSIVGDVNISFTAEPPVGMGTGCGDADVVQFQWPALTCSVNVPSSLPPNTFLPNGNTVTLSANVNDPANRSPLTYQWYVDGNPAGTGTSIDLAYTSEETDDVYFVVSPPSGEGVACTTNVATVDFEWPAPVCNILGQPFPLPKMPDNPTRSYDYTADVTGIAGRTITYAWTVNGAPPPGPVGSDADTWSLNSPDNDILNLSWTWDDEGSIYPIVLTATLTNPNDPSEVDTCTQTLNATVTLPDLTCNNLTGDLTPVIGENVVYGTGTIQNLHGRIPSYSWTLELSDGVGGWTLVTPPTGDTTSTVNHTFLNPGEQYRITYNVSVTQPNENCTQSRIIDTPGSVTSSFTCESALTGDTTPTGYNTSYPYSLTIDNTLGYTLQYTWVVIDSNNDTHVLGSPTSTVDGVITYNFTGAELGPIGADAYTLRVDVVALGSPPPTDYTCSRELDLVVGDLNVNYSFTGEGGAALNANAVEVGQLICLDNTSTTTHDTNIPSGELSYTWDFGTANNSLGVQTLDQPQLNGDGCFSFPDPQSPNPATGYNVRLTGTLPDGRTASRTVNFKVYGSQSLAINYVPQSFAPAVMSFQGVGVNVSNYQWTFTNVGTGSVVGTRTGQNVSNFSFLTAGTYRAQVQASGPLGTNTATAEFTLLAADDISASFVPSVYAGYAPLYVCFTDTSQGANLYQWTWDFGNGTAPLIYTAGNEPSQICTTYPDAGMDYTVELTVENLAGTPRSATIIIRTFNQIEGASTFRIIPQGGGQFCFATFDAANMSLLAPNTYVTSWDFGDGATQSTGDLNYACHNYSASGDYVVRMNIQRDTPPPTVTGSVPRPLTVNLTSTGASDVQMASAVCNNGMASFTVTNSGTGAMLTSDNVTIYDQDGNPISLSDSTFLLGVDESETFTVVNQYGLVTFVTVDTGLQAIADCGPEPDLEVTATCSDIYTVFTVTNLTGGGGMWYPQDFVVTDSGGNTMAVTPNQTDFQVGVDGTISFTVTHTNPYDTFNFSSDGDFGTFDVDHSCNPQPVLSVQAVCGAPSQFVITNDGGDMVEAQDYTIRDENGDPIPSVSGTFQAMGGGATYTIDLTGIPPYLPYTFETSGYAGDILSTDAGASMNCNDPILEVEATCTYPKTFTVTNVGTTMYVPQSFTITENGNDVTSNTGYSDFQLDTNESVTFELTNLNPYLEYIFSSTGLVSTATVSLTHDCDDPVLEVEATCTYPKTFTVTNTGEDMLLAQSFSITENGNDVTSSTGYSDFQLDGGESITFELTNLNPYLEYIFDTTGLVPSMTTSLTHDCDDPDLMVEPACVSPRTFTVTNNGAAMLDPQLFTITQNGNDVTASTGGNAFLLEAGQDIVLSLNGENPYLEYIFQSTGWLASMALDVTHDCGDPQLAMVADACSYPRTFTVTNTTSNPMLEAQPYSVTQNGTDVTTSTGGSSFLLDANGSLTLSLNGQNPYLEYVFGSTGWLPEMAVSATEDCGEPVLAVTSTCSQPVGFTVENTGADMLTAHSFTIVPDIQTVPSNKQIQLASGENTFVSLLDTGIYATYGFSTSDFGIEATGLHQCQRPSTNGGGNGGGGDDDGGSGGGDDGGSTDGAVSPATSAPTTEIAATTGGGAAGGGFSGGGGFGGVGTGGRNTDEPDPSQYPEWETVPTCGYSCPPFLVYHTDETEDWEIFRLDGADEINRVTDRLNLSQGDDYEDVSPSRSPDSRWIVFASNRDDNWELYVAPTNGDESLIQRVTYNDIAVDTDPMWGPNNYVVFESTRDGNWELYMVNMENGQEWRLTNNESSDINPFWSPDGSKLVFQSDREDGMWQLYELDLRTLLVTKLSDGTGDDVDPQYSNDGRSIIFRSYRDGGENSVIYMMEEDGENPFPITSLLGDATNPAWSPDDRLIAYQSDLDGDLDIYIYDVASRQTRLLTDNDIPDYAPTWRCDSIKVVFTSDIMGNPDIYEEEATPIDASAVLVEEDADQLTFEDSEDIYPKSMPPEENASREGSVPGETQYLGLQTEFLLPDASVTPPDFSIIDANQKIFQSINTCPAPVTG